MDLLLIRVVGTRASWNSLSMHIRESEKLEMERTGRVTGLDDMLA